MSSLACRATDIYSDMFIDEVESNFSSDLLYWDDTQQDTKIESDAEIQQDADIPQNVDTPQDFNFQPDADRWDIYQCNAIQEVNISLTELEVFQNEAGVLEYS